MEMTMARDKRLFARLDLDYADHPKIVVLSDAAFRAHITLMLYARKYQTDGLINNRVANRVASEWDTDVLAELQSNDDESPSLVKLSTGDYMLHGYSDMNETKAEILGRQRRNAENGKRGGRPRKTQSVTDSQTDSGTQKKAETETETETEVSSKELTTRAREAFDAVWPSWPKKTEKKKSLEQFVRIAKRLGVDVLADHVRRFGDAYAQSTDRQYVPALAVWLRNERWTDELPRSQPARDPDAWMVRSMNNMPAWKRPSKADEAHEFISRLEAEDATRGSGEAAGDGRELRQ